MEWIHLCSHAVKTSQQEETSVLLHLLEDFLGMTYAHTHMHAHAHAHTHAHTHTHFSRLLGIQFEGLNYVEDFLVQASTEPKLIPVASWIRERRNGLEMCVGVEPNRVEILIMSCNKNVATADGTTRSIVSLLRFYSYQFDGLCNILTYVETYWLDSINRHIPDVYFHLPFPTHTSTIACNQLSITL